MGQDVGDGLAPHAGDDDDIGLPGAQALQPVAQAEVHRPLQPRRPDGLPGPIQGAGAQVGGDHVGQVGPPVLEEPHGEIGVVGADVGQTDIIPVPGHQTGGHGQAGGQVHPPAHSPSTRMARSRAWAKSRTARAFSSSKKGSFPPRSRRQKVPMYSIPMWRQVRFSPSSHRSAPFSAG